MRYNEKMNNLVVVKSFPNGLRIILDPDAPFLELLKEVAMKFRESAKFFGNAHLALSFVGRRLSEEEENSMVEAIQKNADLVILCIMEDEDSDRGKRYLGALKEPMEALADHSLCRIYRMHIKEGEVLESDRGVILLGSVDPGGMIVSRGDIIVCGSLGGEAYAGGEEDAGRYIAAFDLCPIHLQIGPFHYTPGKEKRGGFFVKPKMEPKCARVIEDKIVVGVLDRGFIP